MRLFLPSSPWLPVSGGALGESEGFQGKAWGLGVTGLVSNTDVQRSISSRSLRKRSWAVPETRLNICQANKKPSRRTKEGLYSLKFFLRPSRRHPSCLALLPSDTGVRGGRAPGGTEQGGGNKVQTENSGRATLWRCHSFPHARRLGVRISTEPFALHVRTIDPQGPCNLPHLSSPRRPQVGQTQTAEEPTSELARGPRARGGNATSAPLAACHRQHGERHSAGARAAVCSTGALCPLGSGGWQPPDLRDDKPESQAAQRGPTMAVPPSYTA